MNSFNTLRHLVTPLSRGKRKYIEKRKQIIETGFFTSFRMTVGFFASLRMALLFVILSSCTFAQGFDWQYSARLPFKTPDLFFGIDGGVDYNLHTTNFNICEQDIVCDTFDIGYGIGYHGGLKAELWSSSRLAVFGALGVSYLPGSFKNQNTYKYPPDVGDVILEYEYNSKQVNILGEIGIKYRLNFLLPHLFAAASFKAGALISNSNTFILRKISKADWLAEEYVFTDFTSPDVSKFVYIPEIKIGYDLNMGLGKYASVYAGVGFPLQNRYSEGEWRNWSFSAGMSVYPIGF